MRYLFTICATLLFLLPTATQAHHDCGSAKAFLGINSEGVSRNKAEILNYDNRYGSFITNVYKESAAADAGLQPFDYVYGIDDLRTEKKRNLTCLLQEFEPGESATLHFIRKGKSMTKKVKFRDRNSTHRGNRSDKERAFLGINANWKNSDSWSRRDGGVPVTIVSNSTAKDMGLENGDYITAINGNRVIDWDDVTAAMNMLSAGDKITVEYTRDGTPQRASQPVKSRAESGRSTSHNKDYNYHYNYNNHSDHHDYAYLGIYTKDVSKSKASKLGFENPHGVYVSKILRRTAAEKAGLQVFDYIYGIDEYRMGEEQSLKGILKKYKADEKAELMIIRKGKKRSLPVTFGKKDYDDDYDYDEDECEDPFLGVRKEYDNDNQNGVAVNIVRNSTAEAMDLQDGDVITYINDYPIFDWTDLSMAINMMKVGEQIKVAVARDGRKITLTGKIKSECDKEDYHGFYGEDKEDFEDRMEKFGEDMGRMGEEIGEAVGEAMERIFDGNDDDDDDDNDDDDVYYYNDNDDDWEEQQRDRRRTEASTDMDLNNVKVDMEDMPATDMRELADKADITVPQSRNLSVNQLNLSPNPNMGMFELSFDLPNTGDTRIRIFNAVGRMIYEYELGNFSGDFNDPIDISQNGAGAYFLIIEQNGQALTKKIILSND